MPSTPSEFLADQAAASERAFVLALGGFALEISGASLVTHERIPVPRFNHILVGRVAPERQAAFFERALDHYFQRALRPTVRVPRPVPSHLDRGLRGFSFRPRPSPLLIRWAIPGAVQAASSAAVVHEATLDDLDQVVALWTGERERDEFRRALEVAWTRPHPGEKVRPLLAEAEGRTVGSGVLYEHDGVAGLHGVATVPDARGRGVASALVGFASEVVDPQTVGAISLSSDSPEATRRLTALGFAPLREFTEYELPSDAQLALPSPGPPQGPRWRPPRRVAPEGPDPSRSGAA